MIFDETKRYEVLECGDGSTIDFEDGVALAKSCLVGLASFIYEAYVGFPVDGNECHAHGFVADSHAVGVIVGFESQSFLGGIDDEGTVL